MGYGLWSREERDGEIRHAFFVDDNKGWEDGFLF